MPQQRGLATLSRHLRRPEGERLFATILLTRIVSELLRRLPGHFASSLNPGRLTVTRCCRLS
jgi:hypothetical protein